MKHLSVIIIACLHYLAVWGQVDTDRQLLQIDSKSPLYYVDLKNGEGKVYAMGVYLDVAGRGYSIMNIDTLQKQADGSYTGRRSRIIREKDELYLVRMSRKARKLRLNKVGDPNLANKNLNNAYYLDHYFAMSEELNKTYPLSHHSFRNGYYTWKTLPDKEKEMDYLQFREFTDARLKEIKDNTSAEQDKYVSLKDHIVQNIRLMDYAALKDSLAWLFDTHTGQGGEYGTVIIDTIAMQQPEYFLRLAEDFPQDKLSILRCAIHNKKALPGLKSVKGHDEVRDAFFRERKADRNMQLYVMGSAALTTGFVALLVIMAL